MKKQAIIFSVLLVCSCALSAQFFQAFGVAGGLSYGKESWSNEQWATQEHYLLRYNAAVLAEFIDNENYKWRSEAMYNALGTTELVVKSKYVNATNYISFNNYLKYQYELFRIIPYGLIGPRIEYLFSRSASVFPDAIGGMQAIHLSAAIGAGVELIWFSRVKPFFEVFYNRDIMSSYFGYVTSISPYLSGESIHEFINNHDYEFRVGLKYTIKGTGKCPAVINPAGNQAGGQ